MKKDINVYLSELAAAITKSLNTMEDVILDHQVRVALPIPYNKDAFRAVSKIFMDVLLTNMWNLCERENIAQPEREAMALELGTKLRELVRVYTVLILILFTNLLKNQTA